MCVCVCNAVMSDSFVTPQTVKGDLEMQTKFWLCFINIPRVYLHLIYCELESIRTEAKLLLPE